MANGTFLGTGLTFPLAVNTRGGIAMQSEEEKVKESIRIILNTQPGERAMRPDFGCDLAQFVFERNAVDVGNRAAIYVERSLTRWEPRIIVRSVVVTITETRFEIAVAFSYRSTNRADNIVVPYYLGETL